MNEMPVEEIDTRDSVYSDWLVARRLENQKTSIRLHFLIRTHGHGIGESECLVKTAMSLVKAASSLWRAACLSDRLGVYGDVEEDEFVLTDGIIHKEFVDGPEARAAQDWSFLFHMGNARTALFAISALSDPPLVARADIPAWVGQSYKECWIRHQALLDRAVDGFETIVGAR